MQDDKPRMLGNGRPKKPARQKLIMTEKQKASRLINLEAARKKRAETLKQRKMQQNEYDLSSDDSKSESESASESDNDFIISKKKTPKAKPVKRSRHKSEIPLYAKVPPGQNNNVEDHNLKNQVNELADMIRSLAEN